MIRFDHFNFNVLDLERSLAFYKKALGLNPVREIEAPDGAFKIMFLKNEENDFKLELTWLRDRETPYDLGDLEYQLAFATDEYEAFYARHQEMGCICFDNTEMGIYFIQDPDGYWIEIVPQRQ